MQWARQVSGGWLASFQLSAVSSQPSTLKASTSARNALGDSCLWRRNLV